MSAKSKAWNVVRAAVRTKAIKDLADVEGGPSDLGAPMLPGPESEASTEDFVRGSQSQRSSFCGAATPLRGGSPTSTVYTTRTLSGRGSVARSMSTVSIITGKPLPDLWYMRDAITVKDIICSNRMNVMLVCIPLGMAAGYLNWGPIATFLLNFLALIPLALTLGDVTEDLALRFGDVIGGLLNATFGNIVEVIVSLAALEKGLYTVVATSLIGSVLSNLLLVLGTCMLVGGLKFKLQNFNELSNRVCCALLFLSCIGIIIPTASSQLNSLTGDNIDAHILDISRACAVILFICYFCYLGFQLHTHKDMFQGDDEQEEPHLSIFMAITMLVLITCLVTMCSDLLTGSIEALTVKTGLSQAFLGMIVIPIAGNACEHLTAIMVAAKNKMDLSLGIAIGSGIQISMFAMPLAVLVGWATNKPFSLDVDPFSALVLTISVIEANFITSDATSHWLMGVQLIAVYILIAVTFLYR